MKNITQYEVEVNPESGIWEVIYSEEEIKILFESIEISKYGKVIRHFISEAGERKKVLIQVVIENEMGRTHRLIPDFLIPYRLHCTDTIEKIVMTDEKEMDVNKIDVPCDGNIMKRILIWWQRVVVCFDAVKESIKAKIGIDLSDIKKPRSIVRFLTNNDFWFSIQLVYQSG